MHSNVVFPFHKSSTAIPALLDRRDTRRMFWNHRLPTSSDDDEDTTSSGEDGKVDKEKKHSNAASRNQNALKAQDRAASSSQSEAHKHDSALTNEIVLQNLQQRGYSRDQSQAILQARNEGDVKQVTHIAGHKFSPNQEHSRRSQSPSAVARYELKLLRKTLTGITFTADSPDETPGPVLANRRVSQPASDKSKDVQAALEAVDVQKRRQLESSTDSTANTTKGSASNVIEGPNLTSESHPGIDHTAVTLRSSGEDLRKSPTSKPQSATVGSKKKHHNGLDTATVTFLTHPKSQVLAGRLVWTGGNIERGDSLWVLNKDRAALKLKVCHIENIGSGVLGSIVDSVRLGNTNVELARKTIQLRGDAEDRDAVRAVFEEEIRIMKQISHRHIAKNYASMIVGRETEGCLELQSLIEPLANNGTLESLFAMITAAGYQMSTDQKLVLLRCFGCLAYTISWLASEKHIRHKDLKPANILIHNGMPKLTDFGTSYDGAYLKEKGLASLTTIGDANGFTIRYTAPEQRNLSTQTRTKRNDKTEVWGLGCVFIEILSFLYPRYFRLMKGRFCDYIDEYTYMLGSCQQTPGIPPPLVDTALHRKQQLAARSFARKKDAAAVEQLNLARSLGHVTQQMIKKKLEDRPSPERVVELLARIEWWDDGTKVFCEDCSRLLPTNPDAVQFFDEDDYTYITLSE